MQDYLRLVILLAAGWITRNQQKIIDYLVEKLLVCQELCKGRRLRFADTGRRRRLSVKVKALGRKTLEQFAGLHPDQGCLAQSRDHRRPEYGLRAPVKRILNDHDIEPAPEIPSG